jgi:hypothetical protein
VTDVITAAVLVLVAFRVGGVARRVATSSDIRRRWWEIVGGIRPRHVVPVPLVLAAVLAVASALLVVPGLDWGWWSALGGIGNPVTGTTDRTVGTALEWLIPLVFVALLLPGLPLFAEAEERRFRLGAESWSFRRRVWRGVVFGSIHAIVGIPIAVALALSVGGWYFTWSYLRGVRASNGVDNAARQAAGVLESTRAHTAYNATIILVLVIAIAIDGVA